MKKVFSLLFLFGWINILLCQSNEHKNSKKVYVYKNRHDTIFVEIENGKIIKNPSIGYMPSRNVLKIKVKNVNPFLYNINMQEFQNDYLNEMKDASQTLLDYKIGSIAINFPEINNKTISYLQIKDTLSIKQNVDTLSQLISNVQTYINVTYAKTINLFKDSILHTSDSTSKSNLQKQIDNYDYMLSDSIIKRDKLKNRLSNIVAPSSKKEDQYSQVNIGIQENFSLEIKNYNYQINKLQKLFEFYQSLKTHVYSTGLNDSELVKTKKELVKKYYPELSYERKIDLLTSIDLTYFIHDKLNLANESYQKLQNIYNDFVIRKGNIASENQLALSMNSYLDWLTEERKKITLNALDNIITATVLLYNAIDTNNFSYTFIIDDIKEKTDFIKYVFDATPKNNFQSPIIPKPIRYCLTMPIKGGVQMNVSSGFFFNFGLGNDEFLYKPKTDTSFQISKSSKEFRNTFLPSIGLMMHIYERTYKSFKPALSIGFSTTNATDVKYYFGGSGVFGKNQRWVLSAGICGGEKEVLKPNFGEGTEMIVSKKYKESHLEIETSKKFKTGWFISFTFNLFGSSAKSFNFEAKGTNPSP